MTSTLTQSSPTAAIKPWRRFVAAICLAVTLNAYAPSHALADDPDAVHYDARVQGYTPDVESKTGGLGMTWMALFMMGIICVSVIFKDAKRSHLD